VGWDNSPENWETDGAPPVEILEEDTIPQELKIGQKYHCSWANSKGMVWVLKNINGNQAILETPRTKKEIQTNVNHLRLLNKDALRKATLRIKKQNKNGTI
jgi:ferredoxin-fold anticodon binding domain-containing protein